MTKKPFLNALAAGLYIALVALTMNLGAKYAPKGNSFIGPFAVVSLFTLSAAVMGYLFCYQPAQLYFDGKKKEAVNLFLKTVRIFAVFTVLAFGLFFTGAFN